MAGHSKWKNIQHRKGRQDAQRGKIFTKISKEIFTAVRQAGDDPDTNAILRQALVKARQNNMPNHNIETTIKKAAGDVDGVNYEEILYEGYGPGGVAVMVECLTDNRNRAAADVRFIFSRNSGNLGENGCVSYLFERKGVIIVAMDGHDEDSVMLDALEAGAEDVEVSGEVAEITTTPAGLEGVQLSLEKAGYEVERGETAYVPATTIELEGAVGQQMMRLIEQLEDSDDVQNVHANFEFSDAE